MYYHLIHALLGLMDNGAPSFLIQDVQVAIGDDAEYLDDDILFQIQSSHLQQSGTHCRTVDV